MNAKSMVSVAHAEDSSSASVNQTISIKEIERASTGILKVYLVEGPSFFIRDVYLSPFSSGQLFPGSILGESESAQLLLAGRKYLAEHSAMDYLSRAEHCRYSLAAKLLKKGYSTAEAAGALDYLEEKGLLNDLRFASAWLRNRSIHQSEGRQKLLSGLLSRGVSGNDAREALEGYFELADENDLCKRAAEKMIRIGKDEKKMLSALIRKGFSAIIVTKCLKCLKNNKK